MIKYMNLVGRKARKAFEQKIDTKIKNKVLNKYAELLGNEKKLILKQNLKDANYARKIGIKNNLISRLLINETKLKDIQNSIIKIAKLKDPVGNTLEKWKRPSGLNISKISIPIGVIGVIYESRPNVTSDVANCGHEYTLNNSKFCIKHDSENLNLKKKIQNKKNQKYNLIFYFQIYNLQIFFFKY